MRRQKLQEIKGLAHDFPGGTEMRLRFFQYNDAEVTDSKPGPEATTQVETETK